MKQVSQALHESVFLPQLPQPQEIPLLFQVRRSVNKTSVHD
ncbi:hypothetical protein QUB80_03550 [Chlorogloeopsis sp. ULAP01]|nr:hypothetical protein [Chlorogloeopsis sp. ULAP01]MDM9379774.1 hypothetical protein [Chlorogloeopsis sp. ULAP01]